MDNNTDNSRARPGSPALSEIPELTVLSRSPNPAPVYVKTEFTSLDGKLRSPDGRFAYRGTGKAGSMSLESPAERSGSLSLNKIGPASSVVGEGGFGTLNVLPIEMRREIYGYAFDIKRPVTVKNCCGLNTSRRKREACLDHGTSRKANTGRFSMLHVSKAMRVEANWVLFNEGSLILNTSNAIAAAMWNTATQFSFIKIDIPEDMVEYGDPSVFLYRLRGMVTLLCRQENEGKVGMKSVHVNLGALFHQMLPFNIDSQAAPRYGELLDWLFVHSSVADPDFDMLAAQASHKLLRLLTVIGKRAGGSKWKVLVKTELREKDLGGAEALDAFRHGCEKYGVLFEHVDC
ncbi:hypothetical protein BDW02DRAFT_633455 [Decorospora gaudefroyi]|uniref:Uncharacterized protein n=1 Tax=Decorospora gaudefroyi TaxID=184978 RepID=A0A6A5K044_9PLEO|nr:hypothetical protein BDW02DRAFT_633455 [Decorospora gaudefroyi]